MPKVFSPEEARLANQKALAGRGERNRHRVEACQKTVHALLKDAGGPVPSWALSIAARAKKGSLKALVGLKCADCVCWERKEITLCTISTCPLFPVRPYQGRGP